MNRLVSSARNGSRPTECRITGCPGPIEAKGLCRKHYRWERLYGDATHEPPRGGPKQTPAALERAGVTKRQRDYWCSTGILNVPTDPATGRRLWTPTEVRVAVLLVRLTTAGVAPRAAVLIARDVVERATSVHKLGDGVILRVRETPADKAVTAF